MLLTDNIVQLKKKFPGQFYNDIKQVDQKLDESSLKVAQSRSGLPTLYLEKDDTKQYLHSSYDPVREAEEILARIDEEELQKADHIFFYGLGLGYLAEAVLKKFPKVFSFYEPSPDAFCHLLSQRKLDTLPIKLLQNVYIEFSENNIKAHATDFFIRKLSYDRLVFITLPSYERVFGEAFERFKEFFRVAILDARSSRATQMHFEKRWTINAMYNFSENLRNPSIFDCPGSNFTGKPVILCAAGPSLALEMDNLRKIKEQGLAYIISVGSAIKAFIARGFYPHATASMDPGPNNQLVLEDIYDQNIDSIPLIYGTTVGKESLERYPGPKLYMVMDKDHITPYYFSTNKKNIVDLVSDAPTVAITTMQMLIKLGCNPIILAGQDLAYGEKQRYAEGIKYAHRDHNVIDSDMVGAEMVEDISGNMVPAPHWAILSRTIFENYIKLHGSTIKFYNTSQKGAKIAGTEFILLNDLLNSDLKNNVVVDDWYKTENRQYDISLVKNNHMLMEQEYDKLVKQIKIIEDHLNKLTNVSKLNNSKVIANSLNELDRLLKIMMQNNFYKVFVDSMLMVENGIIGSNCLKYKHEHNMNKRAVMVSSEFGKYLSVLSHDLDNYAKPLFEKIGEEINRLSSAGTVAEANRK